MIRPHGIPVQAMPPLTRFLYIINSGMTPDVAEVGKLMELRRKPMAILQMAQRIPKMMNQHYYQKKKKNDELTSGEEDQAPIGLGIGLASLDAKKQEAKAKAAA